MTGELELLVMRQQAIYFNLLVCFFLPQWSVLKALQSLCFLRNHAQL